MKRFFLNSGLWLLATGLSYAILDTNNNGLSDLWERQQNNGSLFDITFDPQADPDQDGWANTLEAAAGTDPFNANPPDGLIRPATAHTPALWSEPDEYEEPYLIHPETVSVTWPALAGKQYTLFFSSDLTQGSWIPVDAPFIATGGEVTYGFEISGSPRSFWRVAVEDIDADGDALTDHEEHIAGSDPALADTDGDTLSDLAELIAGTDPTKADADGDGWADPQEIAAGTDSRSQDSDGDGIPDSIDSQPLASAFAFADADGDGIPDGDDADPNDPRGSAPSISSANAPGNPVSNLTKDETMKFVLTVGNPAGSAPTAADLAFFLNGTGEPAAITALGSPVASSQRFLLTWVAKTTANYPAQTLQNLTLRFRDSEQATSWLRLARIDVAEWEGKVITQPYPTSAVSWQYDVHTHLNGLKTRLPFVYRTSGTNMVYRGPKTLALIHSDGSATQVALPGHAIPFLKISGSQGGPPVVVGQHDYAALATGLDVDIDLGNASGEAISVNLPGAGISASLQPGESHFARTDATFPLATAFLIYGADGNLMVSTYLPVAWGAGANARTLKSINVIPRNNGGPSFATVTNTMGRDVKITPHAAGTLEYPGLPLESVTRSYDRKYLPLASGEWRKIVVKIFPPQQHFTYSDGYRLHLGTGTDGGGAPKPGWAMQTESGGTLTPLVIPPGGIIEIPQANSPLHDQLTSPQGLAIFVKRDSSVDQPHVLGLDILPKVTGYAPVKLGALTLLPVEVVPDWNRDGKIDDEDHGKVTDEKPWRFWVNDNDDSGLVEGTDIPGGGSNGNDSQVNGVRDLVDWFPLHLDIKPMLEALPSSTHDYVLENADNALNALETTLPPASSGNYLKAELGEPGQRDNPNGIALAHSSYYREIHDSYAKLSADFLTGITSGTGGILLLEADKATSKPLRLIVRKKSGGQDVAEIQFPLSISGVEKMYRHLNILAANGQSGGMPTNLDEPANQPDAESSSKNFVFVHGYNVNANQARGWNAAMFKRLWHSGSRAKFTGVTWYGFESQGSITVQPDVTPNYQANVHNAFGSASALKTGLEPLEGGISIAAHSLGNMVVSSAMHDFGLAAEKYFLIDAAVAKECYDETEEQRLIMSDPKWEDYDDQLRATDWHLLPWPENDWRGRLTWVNRLQDISAAYNFYSTGEEVLKNPQHGPALVPTGPEGVWAAQEKGKGYAFAAHILTSNYGGWTLNPHPDYGTRVVDGQNGALLDFFPKTQAELGPVDAAFKQKLMQTPFFNAGFDPVNNLIFGSAPVDIVDLLGPNASDYASPPHKRNTLLTEMIPAQTTAAGSNPINSFEDRNFDMNAMKTGWPATRENPQNWLHSDAREVAYTFTFKVFDEITEIAK